MNSVLIFGANGFVGRYLSQEFKNNGYRVIASGHSICNHAIKKHIDAYYEVELSDFSAVFDVIEHVHPNYIINLAAVSSVASSWKIPQKTVEVNLIGSLNILETIKKLGTDTKIMLVGSSEEYAISTDRINENFPIAANNPYGLSKVAQEHFSDLYRRQYGIDIVNTRTFNHTGIGQPEKFAIPSFVRQATDIQKSGKPGTIRVGNLSARRDLGDVRDMATAYRLILESDSKEHVFNVGSGNCYYMKEVLEYIISQSIQPIEIQVDPEKLRPLDNPIIWCDNTRLKNETGWESRYSVFDAIDEMFKEMVKN